MTHTIPPSHLQSNSQILRTFEDNYLLLRRIFAPLFNGSEEISLGKNDGQAPLLLKVSERHKYMTIIELNQKISEDKNIPDIFLRLRLYFDARVAEVIAYQGIERIPARYQVKLSRGDTRDEKMQVNLLLNEFLQYIDDQGYRILTTSDSPVTN
ncbi:MAG: DUF1249 domain-containing protein [Chromatiales bacterium]|nr:DUF1249 domain-containing protein [Chromatiales bacterium]